MADGTQVIKREMALDDLRQVLVGLLVYPDTDEADAFRANLVMMNVTVKAGQPIWPGWTGEKTAEDIAGNRYTRVDDVWYNAEEAPLPKDAAAV